MEIVAEYPLGFSRSLSTKKEKEEGLAVIQKIVAENLDKCFPNNKNFPLPSFVINNRTTRTAGSFTPKLNKIEISGYSLKASILSNSFEDIKGTILHELTHWYLYFSKGQYRDGEAEFEEYLAKINAPTSSATKNSLRRSTTESQFIGFLYKGNCEKCGKEYLNSRPMNGKYAHSNCGGLLIDKAIVLAKSDETD